MRPVQHIFFDIGVLGVLGVLGVRGGRPGWWCRPTQQMHAAGLDDPRLATPSLCGFLCCVLMQQMGLVRAMALRIYCYLLILRMGQDGVCVVVKMIYT